MLTNTMIYFINSFKLFRRYYLIWIHIGIYLCNNRNECHVTCNLTVSRNVCFYDLNKNIERRICNEYCCFLLFICILQILQQINNEIMKEILCVFFFSLYVDWSQESAVLCGQCYKSLKGASTEKIKKLFFCMKFNDQVERIEILMEHAKLYKCFGKTGNLTNLNDQRSLTTVIGRCARNNSISPIANQYSRWFFFSTEKWKFTLKNKSKWEREKKKKNTWYIYLSKAIEKNCWRKKNWHQRLFHSFALLVDNCVSPSVTDLIECLPLKITALSVYVCIHDVSPL